MTDRTWPPDPGPGIYPGALWYVAVFPDSTFSRGPLDRYTEIDRLSATHAELGAIVRIYDGDSGNLLATVGDYDGEVRIEMTAAYRDLVTIAEAERRHRRRASR